MGGLMWVGKKMKLSAPKVGTTAAESFVTSTAGGRALCLTISFFASLLGVPIRSSSDGGFLTLLLTGKWTHTSISLHLGF